MKDQYPEEDAQRAFARLDRRLREEQLVPSPRDRLRRSRFYRVAAGVVLLLLSVLAADWLLPPPEAVSLLEKVNLPGRRTRFQLPDGTRVWLNADSRLLYPSQFSADRREIELQGEAFFEVVRDTLRPFIVCTDAARVQVLGTAFNVRARDDKPIETVVVSGSVAFGAAAVAAADSLPQRRLPLVLRAGDRAVLDPATGQTEKSTVDTKAYVAWKDGTLFFEDQPLAEVLPELERWYGVRFVVDNPAINACRITAKFDNLPLATLLDQVQFIVPITYRLEEKQIHLSGESCAPEVR